MKFNTAFELGFRAGYWGRRVKIYQDRHKKEAFELGYEWGEYAAKMPGQKGKEHFAAAKWFIYNTINHIWFAGSEKASQN